MERNNINHFNSFFSNLIDILKKSMKLKKDQKYWSSKFILLIN